MARLPQVTGEETLRRLKRLGMEKCRRSGSHVIVQNPETGESSSVPVHGSKDVKKGTLNAILKQLSISRDDFADA